MKDKINTSELQRKGIKDVYKALEKHPYFIIENQREKKELYITRYKQNLGEIIQIIRKYKDQLKKYEIINMTIFGSFASGEATDNSDIDIVYKTKIKPDLYKLVDLNSNIKKILKEIKNLDLHHMSFVKDEISKSIEKVGINVF